MSLFTRLRFCGGIGKQDMPGISSGTDRGNPMSALTRCEWPEDESPTPSLLNPPEPRGEDAGPLAGRLAAEMAAAWRRGERPAVEAFLARAPALRGRPEVVLRLLCEEVGLRQEAGEAVRASELAGRFPDLRDEVENLVHTRCQLSASVREAAGLLTPALADFEVLAELGRGAQGRVFLARQRSLGDRPVVLKVTRRRGREHLTLARLLHTHIVPLYWVQDAPAHDRRMLCMPYLGGLTLASLLGALRAVPPGRRSGRHLLAALDRACAASPVPLPARGPARRTLARVSYAQAVAWLGACLAEALAYAHERGLVHMDLKPSNILLAADGQPLLLDFHLAQPPVRPGGEPPCGMGGTPLYMAPEQQAVMAALTSRQPIPAVVDERADLYALGVVLYEALGGSPPPPAPRAPRLERLNEQVSPGLADVVHKCLAADPCGRYPDAGALAADLRRHLADLPLRGVPNHSWAERWRKWRRRRPHALLLSSLLALTLGGLLAGGLWYARERGDRIRSRLAAADVALREGQQLLRPGQYGAAAARLGHGLELAEGTEGGEDLAHRLRARLWLARRLASAEDLHDIADRVRFAALSASVPEGDLRGLEQSCRALWDNRTRILALHGAGTPPDETTRRVRADLLDVAIIRADLRLRLARGDRADEVRRDALRLLAEAEEEFGPNAVLLRERERLARALGRQEEARAAARRRAERPPTTAWEYCALGRRLLQDGNLQGAAEHFEQALELAPGEFWPNFYQGECAFRDERYPDAVSAFRVCVALAPASAPAYNNRGLAYARLGDAGRALRDYTHALRLDPNLVEAARNREALGKKR
jgi:tetratricopeptide (TPR) repeat protein